MYEKKHEAQTPTDHRDQIKIHVHLIVESPVSRSGFVDWDMHNWLAELVVVDHRQSQGWVTGEEQGLFWIQSQCRAQIHQVVSHKVEGTGRIVCERASAFLHDHRMVDYERLACIIRVVCSEGSTNH